MDAGTDSQLPCSIPEGATLRQEAVLARLHEENNRSPSHGAVSMFDEEFLDMCSQDVQAPDPAARPYNDSVARASEALQQRLNSLLNRELPATRLSMLGLLSGTSKPLPGKLNTSLDPSCIYQQRKQVGLACEHFLQKNRDPLFCAVATCGRPVRVDEVGTTIGVLLDRVRRINADSYFKTHGVELIVRIVEFSPPKPDLPARGGMLFHVHLHLLFIRKGTRRRAVDCAQLERELDRMFTGVCRAIAVLPGDSISSRIRYLLKPLPWEKFEDQELVSLYHQLHRRRLIQASGQLQTFRSGLKRANVKLHRKKDGSIIRIRVPKRSRGSARTSSSGDPASSYQACNQGAGSPSENGSAVPRVVNIVPPGRYVSRYREPAVIVLDYDDHFDQLLANHPFLKKLHEACEAGLQGQFFRRVPTRGAGIQLAAAVPLLETGAPFEEST